MKLGSNSSSRLFSWKSFMNSRGLRSSPWMALSEVRRKLSTETPGTSTGYCMARKKPALARSSMSISSRSLPSKVTEPPVIS